MVAVIFVLSRSVAIIQTPVEFVVNFSLVLTFLPKDKLKLFRPNCDKYKTIYHKTFSNKQRLVSLSPSVS